MPFALVTLGLILIVSGARDTYKQLGEALVEDFTGPGNFTYWLAAFGAVGSLGYVESIKPFSRAFMALILISMVLANGGFFTQLTAALNQGPVDIKPDNDNAAANTGVVGPDLANVVSSGTTSENARANFGKVVEVAKMFLMG